ncbi:peptidoglycan DD-metalloendopeptidase family protein [Nocardioides hankookensis]|uniref:Peptidoglycan DD-metalloendopeptidase family protein n=1 Tax=Nocardioides hankookensis TaxID=443157 RepID=A0ABW1LN20_9ACTN
MSRGFVIVGGLVAAGLALLVLGVAVLVTVVGGATQTAVASCAGQTLNVGASGVGTGVVRVVQANIKVGMPAGSFAADMATVLAPSPDLVSLNEVGYRTDRAITPPGYGLWRSPAHGTDGTAVLWRTDRWTRVNQGRVLIVEHGPQQWDHDRAATWVTLQGVGDNTSAGTVSMVSVHHMVNPAKVGPNPLRQQIYRQGMDLVAGLVTQLSTSGPVFIAGDFNSQWGANDPWGPRAVLGAMPAPVTMRSSMDTFGKVPTHDGGGTIDYVFAQPAAATPTRQWTTALNSDHRLLGAVFTLTGTPAGAGEQSGARVTAATAARFRPAAATATTGSSTGALPAVAGFDAEQVANAAAVIAAGAELGVPARAQRIAVMTALGESSLRVLDYGDAAGPDSRGLFQQRGNGAWGSLADRMDPRISSLNFYKALLRVPHWETLEPTLAAHETQHNADPYHYERFWEPAGRLLAALTGVVVTAAVDCTPAIAVSGEISWPLDPALAASSDNHNWGDDGSHWSAWHTGTDFSVPCGTPVYAANGGTVSIEASSWAGPHLVKISQGPGALSTWYAHMQSVTVTPGQTVAPGQQIGAVGELGNATGCHLHFEVHTKGGSIYGPDNVNPSTWLAQNVGQTLPAAA